VKNKQQAGFTLVELICAVMILVIVFIPISNLFVRGLLLDAQTTRITQAQLIAVGGVENLVLRTGHFLELIDGRSYLLNQHLAYVHVGSGEQTEFRKSFVTRQHENFPILWHVQVNVACVRTNNVLASHETIVNTASFDFSFGPPQGGDD